MRRFLLSLAFLFSLHASQSQVILNEIYTDPSSENHEFFELYNSDIKNPVDMDCYALVVYYDYRDNSGDNVNKRGFYVLDFPMISVEKMGYFIGAAGPTSDFWSEFQVQKCRNLTPDFNWNSPLLWDLNGSLVKYELNATGTGYNEYGSAASPITVNDMFVTMKNVVTDGVVYGVYLFNNGNYVNGFLGGSNKGSSDVIKAMPPLPYVPRCSTPNAPTQKQIKWADITYAEYVIETPGSDNGYIRVRDGKCGEWVKSSSPQQLQNGTCKYDGHEHSPNEPNGGKVPQNDGFILSTQTTICEDRIDFAILGVSGRQVKGQNRDAPNLFPFIVQLYEDNGDVGILDADDEPVPGAISPLIYSASNTYYKFENIDPARKYLLVFRSEFGCIEKIVSTNTYLLTTTEKDYCGRQGEFTVNTSNFDIGKGSDFRITIYPDKDPTDGGYNPQVDAPAIATFTEVSSGTFNLGSWTGNYFIVYDVVHETGVCRTLTKSKPAVSEALPAINATYLYYCGDDQTGDRVIFDVVEYAGTGAITIEIWPDINPTDNIPDGTTPLKSVTQQNPVLAPSDIFTGINLNGAPVFITFRTDRGCAAMQRLTQSCIPLPVNMGSFTVARNRNKVTLKWETLTEQNNRGFYIQRNTKGVWENRAFIFSAADGGTSTEPIEYNFNDDNSEKVVSQYRIQQVDLDGKVTYSPIRSVRGEGQVARTIIYPNPSDDGKVNVVFDNESSRNVTVSDINGRVVRQFRSVVNSLIIDNLGAGMYLLQITDLSTAETSVEKVIIKKR